MSPDEVNVVASVVRGHRGSAPKVAHETYAALDDDNRAAVDRLERRLGRLPLGAQYVTCGSR